jgi:hypothetical protein
VFDSTKAPVYSLSKDDPNYDDAEEVRGSARATAACAAGGSREPSRASVARRAGRAAFRCRSRASPRAAPRQGSYDLHEAATPATDRVTEYKAAVSNLLEEFFASGDAAEACSTLAELAHPLYGHYFVKRAVRHPRHDARTHTPHARNNRRALCATFGVVVTCVRLSA